jgi:hypothetical protein
MRRSGGLALLFDHFSTVRGLPADLDFQTVALDSRTPTMSARLLAQRQPVSDPGAGHLAPAQSGTSDLGPAPRVDARHGLALIVVVQAAIVTAVAIRSGFVYDDFVNLWISRRVPFGWTYLTWPNYDHFGLGQRLVHYVVLFLGRGRWEVVIAAQVLLGALTTWTAWRLARLVSGSGKWALATVGFTAFSPIWANTWIWWSAAADMVLAIPCMLLVLECAARRLRGGPRWLSLAGASALAVVLTSRERPLLLPAILILLAIFDSAPARISGAVARLRANWDLWIATGLVSAFFLVVDLRFMSRQFPGRHAMAAVHVSQISSFLVANFSRLVLPSLVGVLPVAWNSPAITAIAAIAALVAILVTAFGIRGGWKAWALLAAATVLLDLLLAIGRAGIGDVCAIEPRYSVELLPFMVTTIALLGASARVGGTRAWLTRFLECLPRRSVLVGAAAAFIALSLASTHLYERAWLGGVTSTARRFRQTVAALPPGAALVEGAVPQSLSLQAGPWDAVSTMVGRARPDVQIANADAESILRIGEDGRLEAYERAAPSRTDARGLVRAPSAPEKNGPPARATPGERAFVGVDANPLRDAEAVLMTVQWRSRTGWWNPTTILDSQARIRADPVPAGFTPFPVQAIVPITAHETAIGFELPASAADDVQRIDVVPLRRIASAR